MLAGLELAEQKTEAVLISSRKKVEVAQITVGRTVITSKRAIKYLGVMLDTRLCYREHLDAAHRKAKGTVQAVARMMLNHRGPKSVSRRLLFNVAKSAMLYAAPVWEAATNKASYIKGLESNFRLGALRVASGFH